MNFKLKYLNIERYETKALEKYLEDMALEGWILSYLNENVLRFEKGEKCPLKYSIKRSDKDSFWGGTDDDKALALKEKYESAGWRFVTSSFQTNIFVTENIISKEPSDISLKEELSDDIAKSQKSILIKLLVYIVALIGFAICTNNLNFFRNSNKIDVIIVIASIIVIAILFNIFDFINLLRFKRSFANLIENDATIQVLPNIKSIKSKINFLTIMITTFYYFSLTICVVPFLYKFQDLFMIGILVLMNIFTTIKFELNYRSETTNKDLNKYMSFAILIMIILGGGMLYNSLNSSGVKYFNPKITLTDFNDNSLNSQHYLNPNSIISKSFNYYEQGESYTLSYDFIEVNYKFLVDKYYKDTLDYFKSKLNDYKTQRYFREELGLPSGVRAYVLSPPNKIIVNVKNKIIIIEPVDNISNEDLIKLLYEKLK